MLLLTETPDQKTDFSALYECQAREGLVHSGLMRGERFDIAENFKEEWAAPAVTWSAGGEEHYYLKNGDAIKVRSAGALVLAAGTRYAYAASPETDFRSNMITFPQWMLQEACRNPLEPERRRQHSLKTRFFLPGVETEILMNAIAAHCARGFDNSPWYTEQTALLYDRLVGEQAIRIAAEDDIVASKSVTRAELARRVDRAQTFMLERFADATLNLDAVARAACLSPYHLIRVFKALTGATPMRRLAVIRMEAAMRLLKHTGKSMRGVAAAVGYSDRTAFFKAFKGRFGAAPSKIERPARRFV